VLPPRLIHRDRRGVGQVQRPPAVEHRDAHPLGDVRIVKRRRIQSSGFGAEHQHVAGLIADVGEQLRRMRGESKHPLRRHRRPRVIQRSVDGDRRQVVVVQPGPTQVWFGQIETQRLDEMKFRSGGCRRSDGITRIGRDSW
jgi:hypothetical protein